jgi:hypothetical protein
VRNPLSFTCPTASPSGGASIAAFLPTILALIGELSLLFIPTSLYFTLNRYSRGNRE